MPHFNSTMTRKDIVIIGAGSFGLATAACLRLAGHSVTVVAPDDTPAASVAAGMIAPAMETAIDDLPPQLAELLKRSRALWTSFAAEAGVNLQLMPAEWRGEGAQKLSERMTARGFEHHFDAPSQTLMTHEDAKLDPVAALAAMEQGVTRLYERVQAVARTGGGWSVVTDSRTLKADELVVATGAAASIDGMPERAVGAVNALIPIRGLIGITNERLADHVVRGPGAYIAPVNAGAYAGGSVIGATMENGVRDLTPDPALCQSMLDAAFRILGQPPRMIPMTWRAGIRAASGDGLPLAGPVEASLHLALAPRRNGWLLAPLVGAQILAAVEGRPLPEPALDPRRY